MTTPESVHAEFEAWYRPHLAEMERQQAIGAGRQYWRQLWVDHRAALAEGKPGLIPPAAEEFMAQHDRPMVDEAARGRQRQARIESQFRRDEADRRLLALAASPGGIEALERIVRRELSDDVEQARLKAII